jgi:hypothetical protein
MRCAIALVRTIGTPLKRIGDSRGQKAKSYASGVPKLPQAPRACQAFWTQNLVRLRESLLRKESEETEEMVMSQADYIQIFWLSLCAIFALKFGGWDNE